MAFRTHEADICGVAVTATTCTSATLPGGGALATCDLNDDGDCCDDVLQVYAKGLGPAINTRQAVTPCRLDACDPRLPYRVFGDKVKFLTYEPDQGKATGPSMSDPDPSNNSTHLVIDVNDQTDY